MTKKANQLSWHTEQRRIRDLVPHPENPRQMTAEQRDQLQASLDKFNLVEIPAVNTDNTILAGHQRLHILADMGRGDETIDVRVPSRKLTKDEAREYVIRSNRNTGEWDWDALANLFDVDELKEWGFGEEELLGISVPDDNQVIDEGAMKDTKNECPKCGFKW